MEPTERNDLIARYAAGPDALEAAVAAVPADQLDVAHIAGEWTPRQIVHHVADSETMSYIRLRRLLVEERPVIQGYDEAEWARVLHYDRPIAPSLVVVRAVRVASAQLLATLSEAEWASEGTHSESGRYTLADWLRIYTAHCHDHAEQIRRAAGLGA